MDSSCSVRIHHRSSARFLPRQILQDVRAACSTNVVIHGANVPRFGHVWSILPKITVTLTTFVRQPHLAKTTAIYCETPFTMPHSVFLLLDIRVACSASVLTNWAIVCSEIWVFTKYPNENHRHLCPPDRPCKNKKKICHLLRNTLYVFSIFFCVFLCLSVPNTCLTVSFDHW